MRVREGRVLRQLLTAAGAWDPEDTEQVTADEPTWDQLRMWLLYTDDLDRVAAQFYVRVRIHERVSAFVGEPYEDQVLHMREGATRLIVVPEEPFTQWHECEEAMGE